MPNNALPFSAALVAALLLSCQSLISCQSRAAANREEVGRIAESHARMVAENQQARQRFEHDNPVPQSLDFGEDGTLVLHVLDLAGSAGRELLRVRYSWVNTTDHDIDTAIVQLTLRDPVSGSEWTEDSVLRLPLALDFAPDSSYSDEIRLPTGGVHRRVGWTWQIDVRTLLPEPLEPGEY